MNRTPFATMRAAARLLAVCALLIASQVAAQRNKRDEPRPRPVRAGQTVSDSLTSSDPRLDSDSSHYDLWSFAGKRGERYAITMRSKAFDAYLSFGRMENGSLTVRRSNDDGGGDTDARMTVTLNADGEHVIRAGSLRGGERGAYTLAIESLASQAPVAARPIRLGQTASGRLAQTDAQLDDGSYYDEWTYDGKRGERLRVDMKADSYAAYLTAGRMVAADSFASLASGGRRGDSLSARVNVTLPADGKYVIRANSVSAEVTGGYTLVIVERPPAVVPTTRPIRLGQTVSGTLEASDAQLDDDSYYDLWTYSGKRGQRLQVTMRSPNFDFDTYLAVGRMRPDSMEVIRSDDDGADSTNSKVVITLPEDGDYAIRANSLGAEATGAYTLLLVEGPATSPAVSRSIRMGQTVSSSLDESDAVMDDDSHYELWTYTARRGDALRITMKSSAFDAFLAIGRMTNGEFQQLESDDDGGGDTDARLEFTIPSDGEYVIRANSLSDNETGAYTLALEQGGAASGGGGASPSSGGATPAVTPVRIGHTVSGDLSASDPKLDDDSHYDLYSYQGRAGERIRITLRSGDFDAFLALGRMSAGRFDSVESDDDGGGGRDSQLELTLPADGEYLIRANTLSGRETGRYTLRVERM
ncbi:MAG: PPC domain-containing protein [Gemmatimonadaceae bacterium]